MMRYHLLLHADDIDRAEHLRDGSAVQVTYSISTSQGRNKLNCDVGNFFIKARQC